MLTSPRLLPALLACALLCGCGDPPRPIDPAASSGPAPVARADAPTSRPGPASRPTPASSPESRFAGRLHLQRGLADVTEGAVFVSIHPRGGGSAILTARLLVGSEDAVRMDEELVLPFSLDESNNMMGMPMAREVELKASYRPGGYVESEEAAVGVFPVDPGDMDIDVVLLPGS